MSVATVVTFEALTPSGAVTVMSSCMSPWWNLSVSSFVACADSDVGSWKPPAERLLTTGTPNTAAATMSRAATARTRRGAAIARRAILRNIRTSSGQRQYRR